MTTQRKRRWAGNSLHCAVGGLGYGALEIAWRGNTHISMILAGAICLPLLVRLSRSRRNLPLLCLLGGTLITVVELLTGCVVNLWMGLEVWDYTEEALHLWGQVCPRFFLLWCVLCALLLPLCRWFRELVPRCRAVLHSLLRKESLPRRRTL